VAQGVDERLQVDAAAGSLAARSEHGNRPRGGRSQPWSAVASGQNL